MILYSRHKGGKDVFGTVFYIIRYVMDNLLDFEPINEIICKIRVKIKYYNFTLMPQLKKKINYPNKNFIVFWTRYVMWFPITT